MCANVGETQCYLIKKNSVLKLSKTHRCPDKEEVEKINKIEQWFLIKEFLVH